MKKIAVALAGILVAGGMCFAAPVQAACTPIDIGFPTTLDTFGTGTCIPSTWANELEIKMGVNSSSATSSLDYQINHIFTSYGSEIIASSALPWLPSSAATTTITASGTTADGPNFTFGSSTTITPYASGTAIYWGFSSLAITQFTGNWVSTFNGATGTVTYAEAGSGNVTTSVATSGAHSTTTISLTGVIGASNGGTATTTALGTYAFLSSGLPTIATTSKSIYDQTPATSTDFIPFLVNAPATTTITDVDCYNDIATGNTFSFNIAVSSTITNSITPASSSLVFATSSITCAATSTIASTSTFTNATIGKGQTAWLFFTSASTTGAHVQIDY